MNKIRFYRQQIWKYGFCPLLLLMAMYEQEQKFEECEFILQALKLHYQEYDLKFPLKFTEQAIEDYMQGFWKHGLSGKEAVNNLPVYAHEIEQTLIKYEKAHV